VALGIAIGFIETAEHSTVADRAPTDVPGTAFGLLPNAQAFEKRAARDFAGVR
jgi:hypothetical protein